MNIHGQGAKMTKDEIRCETCFWHYTNSMVLNGKTETYIRCYNGNIDCLNDHRCRHWMNDKGQSASDVLQVEEYTISLGFTATGKPDETP